MTSGTIDWFYHIAACCHPLIHWLLWFNQAATVTCFVVKLVDIVLYLDGLFVLIHTITPMVVLADSGSLILGLSYGCQSIVLYLLLHVIVWVLFFTIVTVVHWPIPLVLYRATSWRYFIEIIAFSIVDNLLITLSALLDRRCPAAFLAALLTAVVSTSCLSRFSCHVHTASCTVSDLSELRGSILDTTPILQEFTLNVNVWGTARVTRTLFEIELDSISLLVDDLVYIWSSW